MTMRIPALALFASCCAATAWAQPPAVDQLLPPPPALASFPPEVARQIRCDMERVRRDLANLMGGQLPAPAVPAVPLPPFELTERCDRLQSEYSNLNGKFTLRQRHNDLSICVTGTTVDGRCVPAKIAVQDAAGSASYGCVDEVPACYREKVRRLLNEIEP